MAGLRAPQTPLGLTWVGNNLSRLWSRMGACGHYGLLVRDGSQSSSPWFFLSRRAQRLKSREDLAAYRRANLLPKGQLHPLIASRVYPAFLRSEYDTAVFQAFREIEIAVREAGGFTAQLVGVELMRQALRPVNRPDRPRVAPGMRRHHLARRRTGGNGEPLRWRNLSLQEPTESSVCTDGCNRCGRSDRVRQSPPADC